MGISENTIRLHLKALKKKFNTDSRRSVDGYSRISRDMSSLSKRDIRKALSKFYQENNMKTVGDLLAEI